MTILTLLFMMFSFLVGYLGWGLHTGLIFLAVTTAVSILVNLATESVFGFFLSVLLFVPGLIFLIGFLVSGIQGGLIGIAISIGVVLWIIAAKYLLKD